MHLQLAWCRLLVADADADAESIDCINTIQEKHTAVLQICRIFELYSYLLVPGCLGTTAETVIIRHDDDGPHRRMTLMCRQHGGLQPKSVSFGHTKRQMSASWSRLCIFSTLAAMNNVGIEKCQPNVYETSSPAKEKR
eukprot:scaffold7586_cov87-Skeletonema_menzelii.AAC.1